MASYQIIDTILTSCVPAQGHVSSVVLDRGGAYLVTDIYDFMDHGHTFLPAGPAGPAHHLVTKMRCRHCGCPTLRITGDLEPAREAALPTPLPVQVHSAEQERQLAASHAQDMDIASTG